MGTERACLDSGVCVSRGRAWFLQVETRRKEGRTTVTRARPSVDEGTRMGNVVTTWMVRLADSAKAYKGLVSLISTYAVSGITMVDMTYSYHLDQFL